MDFDAAGIANHTLMLASGGDHGLAGFGAPPFRRMLPDPGARTDMQQVVVGWTLCLGLLLLLPCGLRRTARAEPPAPPAPALGVGPLDPYRALDRDGTRLLRLADAGPFLARTVPIPWGRIEPEPPVQGRPTYQWRALDEAISVWQLAGLDPVPVLTPSNPWGSVPLDQSAWARRLQERFAPERVEAFVRAGLGCTPPRPERWGTWERFVEAFIERYDGDGDRDAPGLRRPLRYLQILERFDLPSAFAGDGAEVQRLMHHAGAAATRAGSGVRLVTGGFDLLALGHAPLPPKDVFELRLARALPEAPELARLEMVEAFARIEWVLGLPRLYHVLHHVGSGHVADDESNLAFLAAWRADRGAEHVELWLGEPPDARTQRPRTPDAHVPSPEEARLRSRRSRAARLPSDPDHEIARHWLAEGAALQRLRTTLAARAAGASVVFQGACWDGPDALLVAAGQEHAWTASPSFYLLADWNRRIGSATALGLPAPIHQRAVLFRGPFAQPGVAWVQVHAWEEELALAPWPGEDARERETVVAVPPGRYVVQPLSLGPSPLAAQVLVAADGVLTLRVGPRPLWVVPE